ncbi:WD40/YVTN/BNR-like repeat-containing protein [Ktedonospora formicarum]
MERELLVAEQHGDQWQAHSHLEGLQTTCLAVDLFHPERVYCGTFGRGLWRSEDAGHSWQPIGDIGEAMKPYKGDGIYQPYITALAVSSTEQSNGYGVVYAGTEPSTLFRSEDGGSTWQELEKLRALPSSSSWSFPPRPHTSHVRWITPDPNMPGRLFVAIEAGALVRSLDGGQTWEDRVSDAPFDTHTLIMHPQAPERLYSSAGDGFSIHGRGYSESFDGGQTWQRPDEGLEHHYLWGLAVDPVNPDIIVASASPSPYAAHHHREDAQSAIYLKQAGKPWQRVTAGLPDFQGTVIPVLGSHAEEPGVFYALCNHGVYRSSDAGLHWRLLPLPWKTAFLGQHHQALALSTI